MIISGTSCGATVILPTHSKRTEPCFCRYSLLASGEPANGGICDSKKKRVTSYFPCCTIISCTYLFCTLSGTCHSIGSVILSCSSLLINTSFSPNCDASIVSIPYILILSVKYLGYWSIQGLRGESLPVTNRAVLFL